MNPEPSQAMYDIHYHLLFDLDDGPKTLEDALQLAEASIAEGVTHIVSAPHANAKYPFRPEVNRQRLAVLNEHLRGRITVGLGCDMHLSYENIQEALSDPARFTINGRQYLLVEFPEFSISPNISDWFYQLCSTGMIPIITHPERNPVLASQPHRLAEWLRIGCLVQITAASLTGRFGKQAVSVCDYMLRRNWAHFIASDAHSLRGRPPAMRSAYEFLSSRYGRQTAERLCVENPRAAFEGEPLPEQPEPIGPDQEPRARWNFFQRLQNKI